MSLIIMSDGERNLKCPGDDRTTMEPPRRRRSGARTAVGMPHHARPSGLARSTVTEFLRPSTHWDRHPNGHPREGNGTNRTKGTNETYDKILKVDIQFPLYLSGQVADFIGKILNRDPTKRMGLEEIEAH